MAEEERVFIDTKQIVAYLVGLQRYFQDNPKEGITSKIQQLLDRVIKDFGVKLSDQKLSPSKLLNLIIDQICALEGIDEESLTKSAVPTDLEKLIDDLDRSLALNEEIKNKAAERVAESIALLEDKYGLSRRIAERVVVNLVQEEQVVFQRSLAENMLPEQASVLAAGAAPVIIQTAVRSQATGVPMRGKVPSQAFRRFSSLGILPPVASSLTPKETRKERKRIFLRTKTRFFRQINRASVLVNSTIIKESAREANEEIARQTGKPISRENTNLIAVQMADIAQKEKRILRGDQETAREKANRWTVIIAHRLKPASSEVSSEQIKKVVESLLGLERTGRVSSKATVLAFQKLSLLPNNETRLVIYQEIKKALRAKLELEGIPKDAVETITNVVAATQIDPSFYQEKVPAKEIPSEVERGLPDELKVKLEKEGGLSYQEIVAQYLKTWVFEQEEAVWLSLDEETGEPTWRGRIVRRQLSNLSPEELGSLSLTPEENEEFLKRFSQLSPDQQEKFSWVTDKLDQIRDLDQTGQLRQEARRFLWRGFKKWFSKTKVGSSLNSFANSLSKLRGGFGNFFRGAGNSIAQWGKNLGSKAALSLKGMAQGAISGIGKALPKLAAAGSKLAAGLSGVGAAAAGLPVGLIIGGILLLIVIIALIIAATVGSSQRLSMERGAGLSPGEINSLEMSEEELAGLGEQPALVIQQAFKNCKIKNATLNILKKKESCLREQGISQQAIEIFKESAKNFHYLQCVGFIKAVVSGFPGGHNAHWFVDHQPSGWKKMTDRNQEVDRGGLVGSLAVWGPSSGCKSGQSCKSNSSCCGHIGVITGVEKGQMGSLSYLYITQAWGNSGKVSTIKVALDEPTTILKR